MRLVKQLQQKIKQTVRLTQLDALMAEARQKLKTGELTTQEYYFLVFVEKKHFQANISQFNLLPDFSNDETNPELVSKKVAPCEIIIEEFEAIERELFNVSEMRKNFA